MENGTYIYNIETRLPLGKRLGTFQMNLRGKRFDGIFTLLEHSSVVRDGSYENGRIAFKSQLRSLIGAFPFKAQGRVDESSVEFDIDTIKGDFEVNGKISDTMEAL